MENQKKHKRGLIKCGKIRVQLLLPFLVSILYVGRTYVTSMICGEHFKFDCKKSFSSFTFIVFSGESLSFFLVVISHFLNKSTKGMNQQLKRRSQSIALIPSSTTIKQAKLHTVVGIISITSLIYASTTTLTNYFIYVYSPNSSSSKSQPSSLQLAIEFRLVNLFFISLFSLLILSLHFRKHQILASILVAISFVLFIVIDLIHKADLLTLVIFVLIYYFFSLREVIHKYLLEVKLVSSVLIVFIEGIIGLAGTVIVQLSVQLDNFIQTVAYIFKGWESVGIFFLFFILCFLYDLTSIITKYYFEPTVMPVAYSLSVIIWKVILISRTSQDTGDTNYFLHVVFIIGAALAFFGCLVYNEIIILTFWECERDTKCEIIERGLIDYTVTELNTSL